MAPRVSTPMQRRRRGLFGAGGLAVAIYATPWLLAIWASLRGPTPPPDVDIAPPRPAVFWSDAAVPPAPITVAETDVDTPTADPMPRPIPVQAVIDAGPVVGSLTVEDTPTAKARPTVKVRRRRTSRCQRPHPHVRQGEDGVVEVDRSYVEEVTRNLKTFISLGTSRPYHEDGVKGWYITGFGCNSAVTRAGFQRRDVLLTVNGRKTRTWAGVYLLYQKLKRDDAFVVDLLRHGEPVTLRFRVVTDG